MPYFDETSSLDGVNFTPLLLLLPLSLPLLSSALVTLFLEELSE